MYLFSHVFNFAGKNYLNIHEHKYTTKICTVTVTRIGITKNRNSRIFTKHLQKSSSSQLCRIFTKHSQKSSSSRLCSSLRIRNEFYQRI